MRFELSFSDPTIAAYFPRKAWHARGAISPAAASKCSPGAMRWLMVGWGCGHSRFPPFRTERERVGHPSFVCNLDLRLGGAGSFHSQVSSRAVNRGAVPERWQTEACLVSVDCSVIGSGVNFLRPPDMKSIAGFALVLALGFLSGCGSGQSPLPSLTGTWVFTLTPANSPSNVIQATAALTQLKNNVLLGQVTLKGSGTSCGTMAEMTGTLSGSSLTLQLTQSPSELILRGTATTALTVNASGAYTATTGQCLQDGGTGTWTAFLSSSSAQIP